MRSATTAKFALQSCMVVTLVGAIMFSVAGCEKSASEQKTVQKKPSNKLVILTPHGLSIRNAFAAAFSRWKLQQQSGPVQIEWVHRGTPKCVEYIKALYSGTDDGVSRKRPDLFFGGGIADHDELKSHGYTAPLQLGPALANIPEMIAGQPTRDAAGNWFASSMSSFGIFYNEAVCSERGIDPPQTWADLADPRFLSWVGVADPGASGSARQCMLIILQKHGWKEGWSLLYRIIANSRALAESSTNVLDQVEEGIYAATFAVNFDGMSRADASDGSVKYINPPGATAVTPDVVSVLKTSDNPALAEEFVRFVLSEEGQILWGVRAQQREMVGKTLYHYPIMPLVYEKHADGLAVSDNPLEGSLGVEFDTELAQQRGPILVPLVQASGDMLAQLQRAWEALIAAGIPQEHLEDLTTHPFGEKMAYKLGAQYQEAHAGLAEQMRNTWRAQIEAKVNRVMQALQGGG